MKSLNRSMINWDYDLKFCLESIVLSFYNYSMSPKWCLPHSRPHFWCANSKTSELPTREIWISPTISQNGSEYANQVTLPMQWVISDPLHWIQWAYLSSYPGLRGWPRWMTETVIFTTSKKGELSSQSYKSVETRYLIGWLILQICPSPIRVVYVSFRANERFSPRKKIHFAAHLVDEDWLKANNFGSNGLCLITLSLWDY